MKKALMTLPYFLIWVLYFLLTMEKRTMYMMGEEKGMNCIESKDVSRFVPGSTTEYTYDSNSKPHRDYLSWGEFWKARGY